MPSEGVSKDSWEECPFPHAKILLRRKLLKRKDRQDGGGASGGRPKALPSPNVLLYASSLKATLRTCMKGIHNLRADIYKRKRKRKE